MVSGDTLVLDVSDVDDEYFGDCLWREWFLCSLFYVVFITILILLLVGVYVSDSSGTSDLILKIVGMFVFFVLIGFVSWFYYSCSCDQRRGIC